VPVLHSLLAIPALAGMASIYRDDRRVPSMSIAVSAVIHPSRQLRLALALMCLALVAGAVKTFMDNPLPERFLLAGLCILAAFLGFFQSTRKRKTFHIDISGIGQIRLQDYYEVAVSDRPGNPGRKGDGGQLVRLRGDSTLWPNLLLLRLQPESGPPMVLPVLSDSVNAQEFRALAVACRWIAAHNIRPE
jgi:hypothetical protein